MKFKIVSHTAVILGMLISGNAHPKHDTPGIEEANFELYVDTPLDLNTLAFQACTDQPQDCSLRGAISRSNADPGNQYNIFTPGFLIAISLPGSKEDQNDSGDLDLFGSVAINGDDTAIHGNGFDRVMQIHRDAKVSISNIIIVGGKSPDGITETEGAEPGGGIYNAGDTKLLNTTVLENTTGKGRDADVAGGGGPGAGIYNTGSILIEASSVINNETGEGGCTTRDLYGKHGSSGSGGGVYNLGYLSIRDSFVQNNSTPTTNCASMFNPYGIDADAGKGGGIYNAGHLDIGWSKINHNTAGVPGGSGGGIYSTGPMQIGWSEISENISDSGAGIYIANGSGLIRYGDIQANHTRSGQGGYPGKYGYICGGGGGFGGGIYSAGTLSLINSLVESNLTGDGGIGCGPGGDGAGIYNLGNLEIINTPVRSNITGNGGDAVNDYWYGMIPGGRGGHGAGVYNLGAFFIMNSSIAANLTGDGGGDCSEPTWAGAGGAGGGIYNSGVVNLISSAIITNTTGIGGSACFPGGTGGSGGGFYNAGSIKASLSSISGNSTGNGGDGSNAVGIAGDGGTGGDGAGGYSTGRLIMEGITFAGNIAGSGGVAGNGSNPGETGLGGSGGGLFIRDNPKVNLDSTFIVDNRIAASGIGSGMAISGTTITLAHMSIVHNTGGDDSGLHAINSQLSMTNTLVVSHSVGITATLGSIINLDGTLWGAGIWANQLDFGGTGLITHHNDLVGNPRFIAPQDGDYHIGPDSSAIDQGIFSPVSADVDGQPLPNPDTAKPDLGADEYWHTIAIDSLNIMSPDFITANTPFTITAQISPTYATPNILYYWYPQPEGGQYTDTARYIFQNSDDGYIWLMASNAGRTVYYENYLVFEEIDLNIFLPYIAP